MSPPRPFFAVIFASVVWTAHPAAAQWDAAWQAPAPDYAPPAQLADPLEDPPNVVMRPRLALSFGGGATGIHMQGWELAQRWDRSAEQYRPIGATRWDNDYVSDPSFVGTLAAQIPLHRLFSLDARFGLTTWSIHRNVGAGGTTPESGLFWDLGLAPTLRIATREAVEWRLSAIVGLSGNRRNFETEYETGTNSGLGFHVGGSFGVQHMFSRFLGWSLDTTCLYRLVSHEEWVFDAKYPVEFEAVTLSMQLGLVVRL